MFPFFGSRPGGRKLYYNLDLPSFQRDFASLKTLDHGTGPAITFTRASGGTYFDANGVLQTAANDVPRFDHDTADGGKSLGLLIEEARTNSIRNSQAGGSTNGVIGSGGALPTHWNFPGLATVTSHGVALEVIGSGTESGLAYIDLKISGTPSGTGTVFLAPEDRTSVVAANGQSWTMSWHYKLVSGSLTNAVVRRAISGSLSGGGSIAGQSQATSATPTGAALSTQRVSVTATFSDATVVRVMGYTEIAYTSGNPIDLTLRIAAPQLEQGAFPTSYIPTTTAAATRSADSAVVTPISSFYNQSEGTLFAEVREGGSDLLCGAASLDTDTSDNRIDIRRSNDASNLTSIVTSGGVAQATLFRSLAVAAQTYKAIVAYKTDDIAFVINGGAVTTDTSATLPTLTHLRIGGLAAVSPATGNAVQANGHIRKIAYYPRRLSNTLLEQLTT